MISVCAKIFSVYLTAWKIYAILLLRKKNMNLILSVPALTILTVHLEFSDLYT